MLATPKCRPPEIPHLIGACRVTDCSRGREGAPCRGWIPACAGMTEAVDLGSPNLIAGHVRLTYNSSTSEYGDPTAWGVDKWDLRRLPS